MKLNNQNNHFTDPKSGAAIQIKVNAGSAETRIRNISPDGMISIDVKSQNAGNAAGNRQLVDYLAEVLKVSHKQIEIVAGDQGDKKLVCLLNIPVEEVNGLLSSLI